MKPWTRIPVAETQAADLWWRCWLGWHRVRFVPDAKHGEVPRCTRCRSVALWWLRWVRDR